MMASDDVHLLRQALDDLDYREAFDPSSMKLIKKILKDMNALSEHCNDLERENLTLKAARADGQSFAVDSNQTYLIDVFDNVNNKVSELKRENATLKRENEMLRTSGTSSDSSPNHPAYREEGRLQEFLKGLLKRFPPGANVEHINSLIEHPEYLSFTDLSGPIYNAFDLYVKKEKEGASQPLVKDNNRLKEANGRLEARAVELQNQLKLEKIRLDTLEMRNAKGELADFAQSTLRGHVKSIEKVTEGLKRKIEEFEGLHIRFAGGDKSIQEQALNLLHLVAVELSTEIGFNSQLTKLTEKMGKTIDEQEAFIQGYQDQVKSLMAEINGLLQEKTSLQSALDGQKAKEIGLEKRISDLNLDNASLKTILEATEKDIAEKSQAWKTAKTSLDSTKSIVAILRAKEDTMQKHVEDQDKRIETLKAQLQGSSSVSRENESSNQMLQNELLVLRSTNETKEIELANLRQEQERLRAELNQIRTTADLERKKYADIEKTLASKRKEKDMMMATHFKLIKSNEKISGELEACRKELQALRNQEKIENGHVDSLSSQAVVQNEKIKQLTDRIAGLESELSRKAQEFSAANEQVIRYELETVELRNRAAILDKGRTDAFLQLAKLTEKVTALNAEISDLQVKNINLSRLVELKGFSPTGAVAGPSATAGGMATASKDNNIFAAKGNIFEPVRKPFKQMDLDFTPLVTPRPKYMVEDEDPFTLPKTANRYNLPPLQLADLPNLSLDDSIQGSEDSLARGIVNDWARKNDELKRHLKLLQEELRNEVSFALPNDGSTGPSDKDSFKPISSDVPSDKQRLVEEERMYILDVVKKARADFEQAISTPSSS